MAANARPSSPPGLNSSASSTIDLPVADLGKNLAHPQIWTLPHEWNIEKREMFQVFNYCVHCVLDYKVTKRIHLVA